jgi:hypothetical protein
MSTREQLQQQFYQQCIGRGFDAPYGVLTGQESFGAKARTVTFGRALTLDATIRIFGPTFIQVKTSRGDVAFTGNNAVADATQYVDTL